MASAGRTTGARTADSCSRKAMKAFDKGPSCFGGSCFLTGRRKCEEEGNSDKILYQKNIL